MSIITLIGVFIIGAMIGAIIALKYVERELDKDLKASWDDFCRAHRSYDTTTKEEVK